MSFIHNLTVGFEGTTPDIGHSRRVRTFNPIMFRDENEWPIWLSIQASSGHFCAPRITINPEDYDSMEFALVNAAGDFNKIEDLLPDFDLVDEVNQYYNEANGVYAFVPLGYIEELFQELTKKYQIQFTN